MRKFPITSSARPSTGWTHFYWVLAVLGICFALFVVAPRLVGLYWLYWGNDTFQRIFYEHVGLSEAWSSTLGIALSFFYALAMVHLLGRSTWKLLSGKTNPREIAISFVCYFFVFALPHLFDGLSSSWQDHGPCFNQRTGEPIKWYTIMNDGEIVLSDSPGYDRFGTKKLPTTSKICEISGRQHLGTRPHKISIDPRKIEFFDPITRAPLVWYSGIPGNFTLYDADGFDPITSEALLPITPMIVAEILSAPALPGAADRSSPQKISLSTVSPPQVQAIPSTPPARTESSALQAGKFEPQNEPTDIFDFRVCNHTMAPTSIAVMGREPSPARDWVIKGWMRVAPGECRPGGIFVKGTFLITADSPGRHWGTPGITLCVGRGPFKKIHNAPQQCSVGEMLRDFNKFSIASDTWTLNLQ